MDDTNRHNRNDTDDGMAHSTDQDFDTRFNDVYYYSADVAEGDDSVPCNVATGSQSPSSPSPVHKSIDTTDADENDTLPLESITKEQSSKFNEKPIQTTGGHIPLLTKNNYYSADDNDDDDGHPSTAIIRGIENESYFPLDHDKDNVSMRDREKDCVRNIIFEHGKYDDESSQSSSPRGCNFQKDNNLPSQLDLVPITTSNALHHLHGINNGDDGIGSFDNFDNRHSGDQLFSVNEATTIPEHATNIAKEGEVQEASHFRCKNHAMEGKAMEYNPFEGIAMEGETQHHHEEYSVSESHVRGIITSEYNPFEDIAMEGDVHEDSDVTMPPLRNGQESKYDPFDEIIGSSTITIMSSDEEGEMHQPPDQQLCDAATTQTRHDVESECNPFDDIIGSSGSETLSTNKEGEMQHVENRDVAKSTPTLNEESECNPFDRIAESDSGETASPNTAPISHPLSKSIAPTQQKDEQTINENNLPKPNAVKPTKPPTIETQPLHRSSSTPRRRRQRSFYRMGVISESPWDTATTDNDCYEDSTINNDSQETETKEHEEDPGDGNSVQNNHNNGITDDNDVRAIRSSRSHDAMTTTSTSSNSSSSCSPRRRRSHNSGGVSESRSVGSLGGNSSSTGSAPGGSLDRGSRRGSSARQRVGRRHTRQSRLFPTTEDPGRDDDDDIENGNQRDEGGETGARRTRPLGRRDSVGLVSSLDAGMSALRRWIRSRRSALSSAARSSSGYSASSSSVTSLRLGEEDVFALSHAGDDPRHTVTESSTSSNSNLLDSNSASGFLYYRPYEVHIPHDVDTDDGGLYTSDDESGTHSILLHPLIAPNLQDGDVDEQNQQPRQRAFSEPDRARLFDIFNSVYASRAIDGSTAGRLNGRADAVRIGNDPDRSSNRPRRLFGRRQLTPRSANAAAQSSNTARDVTNVSREGGARTEVSTPPIIDEEEGGAGDTAENDSEQIVQHSLNSGAIFIEPQPYRGERPNPALSGLQDATTLTSDRLSPEVANENATSPSPMENVASATSGDGSNTLPVNATTTTNTAEPNRRARSRWIRINRRFQFILSMVALIFSLLLFAILVCWVLLTSTYVISLEKQCDVPIKPYFWLATFQLILDIFRADIMKWMCRWQSDSRHRIPPRIILYNMAYLVYAMLVLRLGVKSVFRSGGTTCSQTAPELFYATFLFVSLSLAAWATIILGYLVPFCFVAILLTRNGYFPNADITSPGGGIVRGGARVGAGIGGMVTFPNTYSNPAPPGCVERLRVVLLDEFPDSYPKECCICMMEFAAGEVIVVTPCEHIFHKRCCHEWLQHSRTCPYCRSDLVNSIMSASGANEESTVEEHHDSENSTTEPEDEDGQTNNSPTGRNAERRFPHFLRREQRQTVSNDNSSVRPQTVVLAHNESGLNSSEMTVNVRTPLDV